jgi:hypothetical protein
MPDYLQQVLALISKSQVGREIICSPMVAGELGLSRPWSTINLGLPTVNVVLCNMDNNVK